MFFILKKQDFFFLLLFCCFRYPFTMDAGDMTGAYSVHTIYEGHEIMFHVSTLLPYSKDNKQQVRIHIHGDGGHITSAVDYYYYYHVVIIITLICVHIYKWSRYCLLLLYNDSWKGRDTLVMISSTSFSLTARRKKWPPSLPTASNLNSHVRISPVQDVESRHFSPI